MPTDGDESAVDGSWAETCQATVRDNLDLEPEERLRWRVGPNGRLIAEAVKERHGIANRLEPVDMGKTDAVQATEADDWP